MILWSVVTMHMLPPFTKHTTWMTKNELDWQQCEIIQSSNAFINKCAQEWLATWQGFSVKTEAVLESENAPAPHRSHYVLQYHPCMPPIMRKERMLPLKVQGRSWHLQLPSLLSLSWEDIMYRSFPTCRWSATHSSMFKIKISQSEFFKMLMIRIGLQNRLNFCNTLGTFLKYPGSGE